MLGATLWRERLAKRGPSWADFPLGIAQVWSGKTRKEVGPISTFNVFSSTRLMSTGSEYGDHITPSIGGRENATLNSYSHPVNEVSNRVVHSALRHSVEIVS